MAKGQPQALQGTAGSAPRQGPSPPDSTTAICLKTLGVSVLLPLRATAEASWLCGSHGKYEGKAQLLVQAGQTQAEKRQ